MSDKPGRYVSGRAFLALLAFAVGLRALTYVLESMLVPDWAVRQITIVILVAGVAYLVAYTLRRAPTSGRHAAD
jgi:uncharacterized membrane protein YidH (DUF202 family)